MRTFNAKLSYRNYKINSRARALSTLTKVFTVLAVAGSTGSALAAEVGIRAGLSSTQYLVARPGYPGSLTQAHVLVNARSDEYRIKGEVRLSNDPNLPIIGNAEELLFLPDPNLAFGRIEPSPSRARHLGVHDRLNQRVCLTPYDCVRGGPIGLHLKYEGLTATMGLLSLPDVHPGLPLARGGAVTKPQAYRWDGFEGAYSPAAYVPQQVDVDGGKADSYTRPSARIGWNEKFGAWSVQLIHAYQPTHTPVEETLYSGTEGALVKNVNLHFPYEQVHSASLAYEIESWTPFTEWSYARLQKYDVAMGSGIVGVARKWGPMASAGGMGFRNEAGRTDPFLISSLDVRYRAFTLQAQTEIMLRPHGRALHARPRIGYTFEKRNEVYVRAEFIRGQKGASLYGNFVQEDNLTLGWMFLF